MPTWSADEFDLGSSQQKTPDKSAWRSFVDTLFNRDWGNTADYVSDQVQRGLGDIAGASLEAIKTSPSAVLVNPQGSVEAAKNMLTGQSPLGNYISKQIDKNSHPQPQDKGDVYAGRVARAVAGNAPFVPEAPAAALLSGVGMGVGGQVGRDVGGDTGDFFGTLIGGAAGGGVSAARNIRSALRIRDGASNPDFNRALNITVDSESRGNPDAVSSKGAKGIMQVMDATARDPGHGIRPSNGTPEDTARVGRQLFASLLSKYGHDYEKTWAAYNWGEGRVDAAIKKHGDAWFDHAPAETQNYVANNMIKLQGGPNVGTSVPPMDPAAIAKAMGDDRITQDQQLMADNVIDFNQAAFEKRVKEVGYEQAIHESNGLDDPDTQAFFERQNERLTPAERQDMDASTEKPVVDNTGYEKHTPYIENPPEPANIGDKNLQPIERAYHGTPHPFEEFDVEQSGKNSGEHGITYFDSNPTTASDYAKSSKAGSNVRPVNISTDNLLQVDVKGQRYSRDVWEKAIQQAREEGKDGVAFVNARDTLGTGNRQPSTSYAIFDVKKATKSGIGMIEKDHPAAEVKRDANPPASSGTFGTKSPELRNRAEPTKSPEGHDEPSPYEGMDPEEKITKALKDAKPVSAETRRLYAEERSARAAKLAELQKRGAPLGKQLGVLKGKMPSADYESIAQHFTPEDLKTLENRVNFSNFLRPHEKVKALEALHKLLGSEGAKVPTAGEIRLLSGVFSDDFIKGLMRNRTLSAKIWDGVKELVNMPRTLMSTMDLSAPFRQGVFMVGRKQFWTAFVKMFHMYGSDKAFKAVQADIRGRPTFQLMRDANLAIHQGTFITDREEGFLSHWTEDIFDAPKKIPGVGKYIPNPVKASDRAYTGFLHKLRADVFDKLIEDGRKVGINWEHDSKGLKQLGAYVNAATGRGGLGKFEQATPLLNAVFFSPRLVTSRMKLLNPGYYINPRLNPVVRKAAIRDLVTFAGIATTVLGLAKMGGAEVNLDPRNADFAKIKIGNIREDVLGGFQQFMRVIALIQPFNHHYVDGKGEEQPFGKYGGKTKKDIVERFGENKLSPVASFIKDALDGKDAVGKPFNLKNEVADRYYSLFAQDLIDAYKDSGNKGAALAVPGVFGVGVQTYSPDDRSAKNDEFAKMFKQDFGNDFSSEFAKDFDKKDFQ
jgi:hypothetical protein